MASTIEVRAYQTDHGTKTALIKVSGPKWMQVLTLDGPLTVRKVATTEQRHMTVMFFKGKPYPIRRAVRHYRHFAKTNGITKNAKTFLKEAAA